MRTVLRPKGFRTCQGFRLFDDTFGFGEGFVRFGGRRESIVAVIRHATGKDTVLSFGQFKFNCDAFVVEQARTVFGTFKFLFEQHIIHKVQVYLFREVEYGAFDKVGRVERDIEMPVKAEGFGIKGSEGKVYTRLTGNLQRIHQVVFIESRTDTGQGADKLISKQGDVVFVNIHVLEDFVDGSLHSLLGEKFVHTCLFASFHPLFFRTGGFPVIVRREQFAG